jgi:cell division protein FtsQ
LAESHQRFSLGNISPGAARPLGARRANSWWDRPAVVNLLADLLWLVSGLLLAYAVMVWFLNRPLFPVQEVVVMSPIAQVTPAQIEFAARSAVHGNFFSVDLDAVRDAFEKLPWVRRAEVRRRWPNAIELRLEEHQAVAYWTNAELGDAHLVNRHGEVFVAASNAPMPAFSGPQGSAAYLQARYAEFAHILEPLGLKPIGVSLSPREAWQLELDNGMVIVLGRDHDKAKVEERLQRWVEVWPMTQERIGMQIAVVDLRYQGGFALTPEAQRQAGKGE